MKNIKMNIEKMIKLKGLPLVLVTTLLATGLSACSSGNKCYVNDNHAHMYVSDDGLIKYVISEKDKLNGYSKSYNYREIGDDETSLYEFMYRSGLHRIDDNMDQISMQQDLNKLLTIYEYTYYSYVRAGSSIHYDWTNDPEHDNLTGEEKEVHYIYQAFSIDKDENGDYVLVPSPLVEDIADVMTDFPYIMDNYFMAVDKNNVAVSFHDDLAAKKAENKDNGEEDKTLKKTY